MDCLSIITSRGNGLTPVPNSGIPMNHWNQCGFQMDNSKIHRQMYESPSQISLNGQINHFQSFGNPACNPLMSNLHHSSSHQANGKYPLGVDLGASCATSPCFTPFGGRKRSLDDDEDYETVKRQRVTGASLAVCNGAYPEMPNNSMETCCNVNTSMMEHQSTMAAVHGYEDYLCNILISQLYGC